VCGIVLSGGESRRFGRPKAFELYEDTPFWQHSLNALKNVTDNQIIVSHPSFVYKFVSDSPGLTVILDDDFVRGKGPMAGIYSAMKIKSAEWYVVLSCDIPRINESTVKKLLSLREPTGQAIIPTINGRIQPLVGLYHRSTLDKIEELLHNGNLRVMALLKEVNVLYVTEEDLQEEIGVFQNINNPEEYESLNKQKK
jgi:molybdopterin-guanine dinucleotide biosynthesis protein A